MREQRALAVKEYTLSTWEDCFTVFVEGTEVHGIKAVERAIKIMKAIDPEFTQSLLTETEETKQNEIIVYHGTHATITEFIDRKVKNYDSIGTYFTSNKEYARMLYGKNTITAAITLNNPLIVNNVTDCESFDRVFYDTELTNLKFNEDNMRKLLLNCDYITALKNKLIKQGYDGIVFQDSRIDLSKEDKENHTVYIVFNANNIRVAK
jgi:hypothetical protein